MKDLPHHMKKINRQVIRSIHREEMDHEKFEESLPSPPEHTHPQRQMKKQAKEKIREEKLSRTPEHLTEEERNRKMRNRVPVFDRNNAAPKRAKASQKKMPPL